MSMFNEQEFKEGLVSELSLFDLPATQISVTDVYYEEIRPLSQVSSDGPFEFRISGQNSMDYVDLKNSQIYVKVKVVKAADGGALTEEKVGPANLFLQTLFSSSEVTLQNKASITCNYNPYRAYIHTILNYGKDALSTQTLTQGWLMDDADSPEWTDPSGKNSGLFIRAKWIQNSNVLDLQGPLFHDLFSMDRYLLNQVDVKIKLYRSSDTFALLAADSTVDFKIEIQDIYFLAKKIRVNPAVLYGHSKILEKQNAVYPYTKVECRSQSIATGSTSFNWENLFQGRRPEKVIIGFVKSKALNGDYTTNPFNFENCGIKHIAVYADGVPVGGNPLKLDFDKTGGTAVMRAYTNLLLNAGKWRQDEGNAIDLNHFISGSTLFTFQLEPEFSHHGEFMSLIKNGNVRLDVQFKSGLTGRFLTFVKFVTNIALYIILYYFIHLF